MARIVVSEFMGEHAVAQLRAAHDVLYEPALVDDAPRLRAEAAGADALVVRTVPRCAVTCSRRWRAAVSSDGSASASTTSTSPAARPAASA